MNTKIVLYYLVFPTLLLFTGLLFLTYIPIVNLIPISIIYYLTRKYLHTLLNGKSNYIFSKVFFALFVLTAVFLYYSKLICDISVLAPCDSSALDLTYYLKDVLIPITMLWATLSDTFRMKQSKKNTLVQISYEDGLKEGKPKVSKLSWTIYDKLTLVVLLVMITIFTSMEFFR